MKTSCPDDETLAAYVDGLLSDPKRSRMEAHLSECDACLNSFSLTVGMVRGGGAALAVAPPEVTKTALNLIKCREPRSAGLLLEKARRSLIALNTEWVHRLPLSIRFAWQPALIRGGRKPMSDDLFRTRKGFKELDADIEIEKTGINSALIRLRISPRNGFGERIRVTLKRRERELCSSLFIGEDLIFEDIPFGPCKLMFEKDGVEIGAYLFHIKETGHGKE